MLLMKLNCKLNINYHVMTFALHLLLGIKKVLSVIYDHADFKPAKITIFNVQYSPV